MEQAMDDIYRQHSRGYRHDSRAQWQVLDGDLSGWPCGKKAAFARHPAILPAASASGVATNWAA
jgi:hypothetical protein